MKRSAAWPTISQTLKFKSVQNAVAGLFFFSFFGSGGCSGRFRFLCFYSM